jgi:hypothetical protein
MPEKIKSTQPFYWCVTCGHSPSWHESEDNGPCLNPGCPCKQYKIEEPPQVPERYVSEIFQGEDGEFAADMLDQIEGQDIPVAQVDDSGIEIVPLGNSVPEGVEFGLDQPQDGDDVQDVR